MSFRPILAHAAIGGALLLLLAPATGFAQAAPAAATVAQQTQGDVDYLLGPEDEVSVTVLGRTDFKAQTKVSQDGTVQMPYVGKTKAAGLTAGQLGDEIKRALQTGGFFANPIMDVQIVSYASKYVTVLGEVNKPGLTPVDRPYHLSELLARVGGANTAAADYVTLTPSKGAQRKLPISDLATGGEGTDPMISPGDKIYVPKAEVFYISGQVKAPGTYPLTSDMTLRMAIARGGGLTDLGTDHGVKVTHKGAVKPIKTKLEEKIQASDVIVVGERLF
jgi:polysaccharide export outer membrane protein